MREYPFCKYHDDGSIEVFGTNGGYPRYKGVIPAPNINHTEEERTASHKKACDDLTLQGYLFTKKRLIRNIGFDRPGEKTTLSVAYRPCKDETEIKQVFEQIRDILRERAGLRPLLTT
jgi:hypothetical protein